jgi:DNA polymerase-3 subunit delta
VNAPTPSTVLIMLADKLDGRTRFATGARKKGYLFEAYAPSEREIPFWLENEARRRGTSFGPGAAASLALAIGADLGALSDALDRLRLFAGDRAITERDVDETVVSVREASQFELADAVGERNLPRALGLVSQLMRQREPGLLVLTFVARQIRILCRAREAIERGDELASALRLPPFVANKVGNQAKRWSAAQLIRALRICARADDRLKTGGGRDRDARVLEELVLALCGGPGLGESATAG